MMYYPMYFDPTYILVLIGVVISLIASAKMNSTFSRYSRVRNHSGMTGRDAAEQILHREGLYDVRIEHISGNLTDHYDPRTKTLRLSDATYNSTSVAALGVSAHECGHAVQHARAYSFLQLRSALVPAVQFTSNIVGWVLLGGILLVNVFPALLLVGILMFALSTLFSFVTLPVEIDASKRASQWLQGAGITSYSEHSMAVDALKSAAYTYVVAALSSLATLIYYVAVYMSRRE